nr:hypothetical protein [Tanacetum cinerariifolium]
MSDYTTAVVTTVGRQQPVPATYQEKDAACVTGKFAARLKTVAADFVDSPKKPPPPVLLEKNATAAKMPAEIFNAEIFPQPPLKSSLSHARICRASTENSFCS